MAGPISHIGMIEILKSMIDYFPMKPRYIRSDDNSLLRSSANISSSACSILSPTSLPLLNFQQFIARASQSKLSCLYLLRRIKDYPDIAEIRRGCSFQNMFRQYDGKRMPRLQYRYALQGVCLDFSGPQDILSKPQDVHVVHPVIEPSQVF